MAARRVPKLGPLSEGQNCRKQVWRQDAAVIRHKKLVPSRLLSPSTTLGLTVLVSAARLDKGPGVRTRAQFLDPSFESC